MEGEELRASGDLGGEAEALSVPETAASARCRARASVASLSPESVVNEFESIMQSLAEENLHERSTAVAA